MKISFLKSKGISEARVAICAFHFLYYCRIFYETAQIRLMPEEK